MIRRALTLLGLAVVILGVLVGIWAVVSITTDRPVTYESIEDHFKYGSIGSEPGGSLLAPVGGVLPPYWCSGRCHLSAATSSRTGHPGGSVGAGVSDGAEVN